MQKSTGESIFRWLMVSLFSALFANVCSFAQITATATPRITQAVVDTQRTTLKNTTRIAKLATADAGALSNGQKLEHLILLLKPSDTQQRALTAFLAQQHDVNSSNYRQWLTPAEFGERFGVADADIQAINTWLASYGLTVEKVSNSKTVIMFSGTHSQFQNAFKTTLHTYTFNGKQVIANNVDPQIPAALAPVVKALVSLNSVRAAATHHDIGLVNLNKKSHEVTLPTATKTLLSTSSPLSEAAILNPNLTISGSSSTYYAVTPWDLATIYNLKPLWNAGITGAGQKLAILGRSRVRTSDVDYFRSEFGLPATKLETIIAGDTDPGYADDEGENNLDVQWSGAVAKEATIELVIAASTDTTDGLMIAAEYAVDNNVAPVISASYGECELGLSEGGNAIYNALWEQAAAQGQSIFISSGDAGAAGCDSSSSPATEYGLAVNGLASTPYNVAVGGTDFYGNYESPISTYWKQTNDTNLSSAFSYIPESGWSNSCANPLIYNALLLEGYSATSPQELCDLTTVYNAGFVTVTGTGGGASNCVTADDYTFSTCGGAYKQPSWQANVPGIPDNSVRNIPDVSLFSANGVFGSFYVYCESDVTTSGTCDLNTISNLQAAGGTSFASPIFAGIMALVNQQTSSMQGNPNPVFYKMAAEQYSSGLDCSSSTSIPPASCIFHDVTLGANQVPCYNGTVIGCPGPYDDDILGITSGYLATTGYDDVTGLGSVDITNLVNNWSSIVTSLTATTTTLNLGGTTAIYGQGVTGTVTVASSNSSSASVPSGDVEIMTTSSSESGTGTELVTLSAGTASVSLTSLPVGTYNVYANYGGDDAFSTSTSAKTSVTISQAATTLAVTQSGNKVTTGQSVTFSATISASGSGAAPTGTITVTNSTTGSVLGSAPLTSAGTTEATAVINLPATDLQSGANTLLVAYNGDTNYKGSAATTAVTFDAPYTIALSSSSLNIGTASGSSASTTVTISSANNGAATWPISLSCSGSLPAGASCNVTPIRLASGVTTAQVTVSYSPVVAANSAAPKPGSKKNAPGTFLALGFACLSLAGLFRNRKRWLAILPCIGLLAITLGSIGCGSSVVNRGVGFTLASSSSSVTYGSPVTLTVSLSSLDASHPASGTVAFADTVNGATTTIGSAAVSNSAASYTVSEPSLGSHVYQAIYSGDTYHSAAQTASTAVQVSYNATLTVKAVDANGNTVTSPLAVTIK